MLRERHTHIEVTAIPAESYPQSHISTQAHPHSRIPAVVSNTGIALLAKPLLCCL